MKAIEFELFFYAWTVICLIIGGVIGFWYGKDRK